MPETPERSARIYTRPSFLVACLALVCLAWAFVIPPFGGADEPGHFIRAAAMARGQLTGAPEVNTPDGILYWRTQVRLDPRFDAANAFPVCFRFRTAEPACGFYFVTPGDENRPATASIPVDVGLYPPAPYLLPAIGTVFGPRLASLYASRLLTAAGCLVLLAFAFAAAQRRRSFASTGLLLIVTPAIFFFSSTVNPSGFEICGALAAWYLMIDFWNEAVGDTANDTANDAGRDLGHSRLFGVQTAVALVVCAVARPLGPLLVGAIVGCTLLASGLSLRHGWRRVAQRPLVAISVGIATALSLVWYVTMFSRNTHRALAGPAPLSIGQQLRQGLSFFPELLRDAIGNFGWLDTPAPRTVWIPWVVALGILSIVGLVYSPSKRHAAGAMGALVIAIGVMVSALFQSYTLFHFLALQARHYLPFALGFFVLLMDHITALKPIARRVLIWAWAGAQSLCLAQAARRYLYGIANPRHPLEPGLVPWQPVLPVWGMVALGTVSAGAVALHFTTTERIRTHQQ